MITKKLLLFGSMAVMGIAFMSCSKEDLYNENAYMEQQEAIYKANFEKRYGKIDPNQSWDFSTDTPIYSVVSSGSTTRTVASAELANFNHTVGSMEIQQAISEYMFENLPKGQNNSAKGRKFKMKIQNDFTIVPIFQGCASYYWELWMSVDGVGETKVWEKGQNLLYKKAGSTGGFTPVGTGSNGMDANNGPYVVNAPTFTYTNLPVGKSMTFSLRIWKGGETQHEKYVKNPLDAANQPTIRTSVEGWMLDLQTAPVPNGLPAGYTATVIGCEDSSDKDFEDLVFMVYGKPVPPTERVERYIEQKAKRYIMEDLGETDDFDFNDVVFDIFYDRYEVIDYYYNETDIKPYKTDKKELADSGIVRAAGGTLDFEIQIAGQKVWAKSDLKTIKTTDMVNTQSGYNAYLVLDKFAAPGYLASKNNISVTVETRGDSDGKVYTIPFPEEGKAPKIVAIPVIKEWMTERTKVPVDWFTPKPKQ